MLECIDFDRYSHNEKNEKHGISVGWLYIPYGVIKVAITIDKNKLSPSTRKQFDAMGCDILYLCRFTTGKNSDLVWVYLQPLRLDCTEENPRFALCNCTSFGLRTNECEMFYGDKKITLDELLVAYSNRIKNINEIERLISI